APAVSATWLFQPPSPLAMHPLLPLGALLLMLCAGPSLAQFFGRPGQEPTNGELLELYTRSLLNQMQTLHPVINSLLTPIMPRSECTAAVDNRVGLCMPKSACLSSGGY